MKQNQHHTYYYFSRAGGGGSRSSSSHGSSSHSSSSGHSRVPSSSSSPTNSSNPGLLFMYSIATIVISIFLVKYGNKVLFKKSKADPGVEKEQTKAAAVDSMWSNEMVQQHAKDVFIAYQSDWSEKNLDNMKTYMTPQYFEHVTLIILGMKTRQRTNRMEDIKLNTTALVDINDDKDNVKDSFVVQISASARDSLIDDVTGKVLYSDLSDFTEYWHFIRQDNKWLLGGISQSTEDAVMHSPELHAFAYKNGLYFSPDFGWLLLPQRGQLFGDANFLRSDVNNHVIGMYRDILIEFYDYIPDKQLPNNRYVIAQAALPKSYGNIVVRRVQSKVFKGKIKGLTKVETEWNDFNKKYEVFASDMERVTSFELLNPVYMEKLENLPYEVSIEVVDNVVYLFTTDNQASFDDMLRVLKSAFEEMKL